MAQMLEKTVRALNSLALPGSTHRSPSEVEGISFPLLAFLKRITQAKSKKEEATVVTRQLEQVRLALARPGMKLHTVKSCLVYAMYCEILGYPAEFAYIHAVKLAQQGSMSEKRTGYLACCLFLHEGHELVVLFVNGLLRDLASTNPLEVTLALVAICHFLPAELVPAVLPLVCERLKHPSDYVRKKALAAVHYFVKKCPEQGHLLLPSVRQALADVNPGVVAASLLVLADLAQESPSSLKDLVPALIDVQKQILQEKLPDDYKYKSMWAPWMQIDTLRLLRLLCKGRDCEPVEAVLHETLGSCFDSREPIAVATAYECILAMLDACSRDSLPVETILQYASQLIGGTDSNLRHTGLSILGVLMKMHAIHLPRDFEVVVTRGLHHPDYAIQIKSLHLLAHLANKDNVHVICNHILTYMDQCRDVYLLNQLACNVTNIAERHGTDKTWLVGILFKLLTKASEASVVDIAKRIESTLLTVSDADAMLEKKVLQLALKILTSPSVLDTVLELCLWIVARCSSSRDAGSRVVTDALVCLGTTWIQGKLVEEQPLGLWLCLLNTLQTVLLKSVEFGKEVAELLQSVNDMRVVQLREQSNELLQTIRHLDVVKEAADLQEVDFTLSFLDEFVIDALKAGGKPYRPQPPWKRKDARVMPLLDFLPHDPSSVQADVRQPESWSVESEESLPVSRDRAKSIPRVWKREGRVKTREADVARPLQGTQEGSGPHVVKEDSTGYRMLQQTTEVPVATDPLSQLLGDDLTDMVGDFPQIRRRQKHLASNLIHYSRSLKR